MFESTRTVREYAVEMPAATRIFESLGIDYCCGGHQSLAEACAKAGVAVDGVLDSLKKIETSEPNSDAGEWKNAQLSELITHIVEKHHVFTREELERLDALLQKVCGVHGQNHPELFDIQSEFKKLRGDLEPHMLKEEYVLFPHITLLEQTKVQNAPPPTAPFITVRNPVRMMKSKNVAAGDILMSIRQASYPNKVPGEE
jgi:regulator of cell morphogenesis and NO signaling